ncbi:NEL-type E3 ubiquitin ligase domain-containing protein [Pseudomonas frederiksbergensis]|uniref:NEL-type E3 ubiquitin ligase domain-containing protein n=1 Tax=Pseudomonas frederiksbergensis TaxID=104087 RepID=UPI003D21C8F4
MSSTANDQTPQAMTPEEQGVFFEFFKRKQFPQWLFTATAERRKALHASLVASHHSRADAVKATAGLKSPEQFCTPLLAKAMSDKLGEPLDIRGIVFQHVRSTSSLLGLRKKLVLPIDRDLLAAACENFEASETLAANYHEQSLIYQPERVSGRGNKALAIEPHEFAELCRTLDLGKQYQTHLDSVFEPYADNGEVRKKCVVHSRRRLDVDRQMALMKGHIDEQVFQMLGQVLENIPSIKLGSHTVACKRLELMEHALHGAVLFVAVSDGAYVDNPCVLYLPGDPEQPLKQYPSYRRMEFAVSERLGTDTFGLFISGSITLSDRVGFKTMLKTRLMRSGANWLLPAATAYIPVMAFTIAADPFAELYRQRVVQVMADARQLVVPTDDEDEKTRLARHEAYKELGLDLVVFGASFIPVVGEILMALAAGQLLLSVYHGVESWAAGEQEQATDYFFDTLENLIVMTALAAGVGAAKMTYLTVRGSRFVERLRQVRLASDNERLWKPDLLPYRQNMTLPAWLKADERGLRWFNDQAYLAVGKEVYAVRPQPDTGLWEVMGPTIREAYAPRLETNDAGAWRHDSELPQEWDRLRLFRRMGYPEQDIPDARALQILSVSAIDERILRRVLIDGMKPPAVLTDTVRRFAVDDQVIRFIEQLNSATTSAFADTDLQFRLLMTLKKWPKQLRIKVVDAKGRAVEAFAHEDATTTATTLTLTQAQVQSGQFYPGLLAGLSATERASLLDTTTLVPAEQIEALVKVLAEQADRERMTLFTWLYQRGVSAQGSRSTPLRHQFPDLPLSVLDELVHYADTVEWDELDAGKVPLRLAEEARRFQQVVRIGRAYEGLYLSAAGGIDTDRLVFNTLKHLPGWTGDIYLRLLEWSFYTEDFASLGSENATQKLLMNAHPDRYDVLDENYDTRSYLPGRTREHYFQALWEGLTPTRRAALGVAADERGVALREKITALALERRGMAGQVLGIAFRHAGYVSPMRLADPLLVAAPDGLPSVPLTPPAKSSALIHRAKELYPTHSPEQIDLFLTGLGSVEVLAARKLESLRLEFLTIRQVLQNWIMRDTWYHAPDGARLKVSALAKTRASREIIRCWRRETPSRLSLDGQLYELVLPPLQVGELPLITGDFSHVGTLVMDRVGASAGLNSFLHNFKQLRKLSLVGNQLTRLAQAIGNMPLLETLNLSENQIRLTSASVDELAGLTHLKTLNLSNNPTLNLAPNVAQMTQLKRLDLRSTGINQWPPGATGLPRLQVLDLRYNRISQIPEDVYAASNRLNNGTDIAGNPLSPETFQRVVNYQLTTEISLGLAATGQAQALVEVVADMTMSSTWLTGVSAEDAVQKRLLWSALLAYPEGRPFFSLLARLRYTADFRMVYRSLSQRVWDVVSAAAEDDVLRRALFRMADTGRISVDGYTLLFSDLHVRVLCYRALAAARGGADTVEGELTRLLRGLFRLQAVEKLALKNIISRRRTGPVTDEQAMEISLAYRIGLAERLQLPAQPLEMNFRLGVEVIPQTLDWVYSEVVKAEHTTQLIDWITDQDFWTEYLESAHREQFEEMVIRAAAAFAHLDSQQNYTREQFTQSMNGIVTNFANERAVFYRRLTSHALQRHPGLALPVTPGG